MADHSSSGGAGFDAAPGLSLVGGEGPDSLLGATLDDTLSGGGGADTLSGRVGDDSLSGGAGDDSLLGGTGADTLSGGAGGDAFGFDAKDSSLNGASQGHLERLDHITDWTAADFLTFVAPGLPTATLFNYSESVETDFGAALAHASFAFGAGAEYYVAQVSGDLIVFTIRTGDAVILTGRTLADISVVNIGAPHSLPGGTAPGVSGTITGDMDAVHLRDLLGADIANANSNLLLLAKSGGINLTLGGAGFTYDADEQLTAGLVNSITFSDPAADGPVHGVLTGVQISAAPLATWVATDAAALAFSTVLAGNDTVGGGAGADVLRGYDGNDLLYGLGGRDSLYGGNGDDTIAAGAQPGDDQAVTAGLSYLRGEDGNDLIEGGAGFDDINGNMGADTAHGRNGDDWVVGGKDQDQLFGDEGDDIVWGNLGNDTLDGGNGNDQVRGGQGDDVLTGGPGNDFVSGDRGNDTITGGTGADLFHGSQDAGIDRVLDFSLADGDKVMLDPGTTYTVSQVGADTVIDFGSGNQMILVGVQMSSLPAGTIFLG